MPASTLKAICATEATSAGVAARRDVRSPDTRPARRALLLCADTSLYVSGSNSSGICAPRASAERARAGEAPQSANEGGKRRTALWRSARRDARNSRACSRNAPRSRRGFRGRPTPWRRVSRTPSQASVGCTAPVLCRAPLFQRPARSASPAIPRPRLRSWRGTSSPPRAAGARRREAAQRTARCARAQRRSGGVDERRGCARTLQRARATRRTSKGRERR